MDRTISYLYVKHEGHTTEFTNLILLTCSLDPWEELTQKSHHQQCESRD